MTCPDNELTKRSNYSDKVNSCSELSTLQKLRGRVKVAAYIRRSHFGHFIVLARTWAEVVTVRAEVAGFGLTYGRPLPGPAF